MSTNLPKSRNRNLPPPPAAPAVVRHHSGGRVAPPEAGHQAEPPGPGGLPPDPGEPGEPGQGTMTVRSLIAMLLVGGLLFAGIYYYIHGSDSEVKREEQVSIELQALGRRIWDSRGFVTMSAGTEEREKDIADLPRIFAAAHAEAAKKLEVPRIVALEGDPPPGRGNASHQIQFFFSDMVKIILRVYVDPKDSSIQFIGVNNRFVDSREVMEEAGRKAEAVPPAAPRPAPVPPRQAPSPAEKVSELPVNPPQ